MPHTPVLPKTRKNARLMRRAMTEAELKLWNELRAHRLMGLSFRRQSPLPVTSSTSPAASHKLIVELDGSQHGEEDARRADEVRTLHPKENGWAVLRFWNDDVLKDVDGVCGHIVTLLEQGSTVSS